MVVVNRGQWWWLSMLAVGLNAVVAVNGGSGQSSPLVDVKCGGCP